MNSKSKIDVKAAGKQAGRSRLIIPAIVFFLAGAVLTASWFSRNSTRVVESSTTNALELSDATKAVLQHLGSPVEIRYYSLLDPSSVPASVQSFAERVDQLLSQYEGAAGDRVKLTRCSAPSQATSRAAQADGIRAFNIDKGDACFLGIAVVCGAKKEMLSQLAPEWEKALEPDLTRAIERAAEAAAAPKSAPVALADATSLKAVRQAIPDLDSRPMEDCTQVLRDTAMLQLQREIDEIQADVSKAEANFLQADSNQSESGRQAAREELMRIQARASAKLRQLATDSHNQVAALQELKKTTTP